MPDVTTYKQREAIAVRVVETTPGTKLTAAAVRRPGSLINIVTAIAAALADDTEERMQAKLRALTFKARGAELDAVVAERTFRIVTRHYATPATTSLSLRRTAPIASPLTLPAGARVNIGGVTFTLDAAVAFGAGDAASYTVDATASAAGTATNVPMTSTATYLETTSDPVAVTVLEDAAGGAETETDDQLVARAQDFPKAVRRGTSAALVFGALQVPGIRQAVAVDNPGVPLLYVADANGQCNAALLRKVRVEMREWGCCGLPPSVIGSVPSWQTIVIKLGVLDGYDPATVRAQAQAAVIVAVNSLPPNARLQRSLIIAALRSIPGAVVNDDAVVTPALDIVPTTPGTTYRTRLDLVVVTS